MSAPALDDRDGSKQVEDTLHRAYEVLRQEIPMGVLHPGAVLSQMQAASRLGISRTPSREALRRLTAEGLVTGDFGRRARVSELDLDDYDQIHAMRVALEPMAMRVTVPHLTSGEIAALAAAVDGMDAAVERGDRWAFRGAPTGTSTSVSPIAADRACAAP